MKLFSLPLLTFLSLLSTVRAGMLAGPEVNPANGHVYYLLTQNTWTNAEAEAVSLGGHLATVRNAAEQRWIFATFARFNGALWIGLTGRDNPLDFHWTSGEPLTYTNWEPNHPDNPGSPASFALLCPPGSPSPGKWNDCTSADNLSACPVYGVVEITTPSKVHLSLRPPADSGPSEAVAANTSPAAGNPRLHASTAIELSWMSQSNRLYQLQWSPSLESPQWQNLDPVVSGNGAIVSYFASAHDHLTGFYRLQLVQ
jgi:Lectin C-type domain